MGVPLPCCHVRLVVVRFEMVVQSIDFKSNVITSWHLHFDKHLGMCIVRKGSRRALRDIT